MPRFKRSPAPEAPLLQSAAYELQTSGLPAGRPTHAGLYLSGPGAFAA